MIPCSPDQWPVERKLKAVIEHKNCNILKYQDKRLIISFISFIGTPLESVGVIQDHGSQAHLPPSALVKSENVRGSPAKCAWHFRLGHDVPGHAVPLCP